ncbi:MAG: PAS domain S-box protein [Thermodesulfobacteriota bacterium]
MYAAPRVLVVEDEMIVSEDLAEGLMSLGYEICGAVSRGEDAVKLAETSAPDLVLMDIKLKGEMDGIEAAQLIRARLGTPIIFLTSYADSELVERAKLSEPSGYLIKPFSERELQVTIEMALYRAKMERRLRESEQFNRFLVENSPLGILVTDRHGQIRYANPAAGSILGYPDDSVSQILGKTLLELPGTRETPDCADDLQLLLAGRPLSDAELSYSQPGNHREQTLYLNGAAQMGPDGTISGTILTLSDLTERLEAEEELRRSEARHRALLEAIPDAVVVYDAEGKVTFVNEGFREMYGWSGEELMGGGIDFVPLDESEATAMAWERVSHGEEVELETKRLTKAGDELDIQLRASILRGRDGERLECIVVHRDITQRKMAERVLSDSRKQLEVRVQERTAELLALNEELKEEIRQRRLAEQSAVREKENLERVFEAMADGVHIVDQNYDIQYVNRALENDFGPTRGRKCYQYFHDRSAPCPECHMQKVFERPSVRQEWRSFKTGKTYELVDTIVKNADGTLSKLEIFRDISRRKKAEKALKENEKRYRELVENAGDLVFQTDSNGYLTFVNTAAQKIIGYSENELIGKHFQEFVDPNWREEVVRFYGKQFVKKVPETYYEFPAQTKTGRALWLGQKVHLLIEGDEIRGMQAIARDITERREAEQALRESEERFRELADLLPQFVYEMNTEGNLTFSNKAGLEAIGYTWDDIRAGMNGIEVFSSEDRHKAMKYFAKVMQGEQTHGIEYRLRRKDGSLIPAITYSSPILRDGKVTGMRGVAIDLSRLKEMEAQLRHAQKMQAVGTLAGGIAHDFNNMLSPIIMGAEMALDEVEQGSEARFYLEEIRTAAERAADLVRQILIMSRYSEPETKIVSLSSIFEEFIRFSRATLPATIQLHYSNNAERDTIEADPTQMQQVLMNLATNAAHAMGAEGGVLKIDATNVAFNPDSLREGSPGEPATHIKLTVTDSGYGMTPEVRERIFEPYFTTKQAGEGSGLGLAVVHGIVQRHGAAIKVESTPGEGSVFSIYFPLVERRPGDDGSPLEDVRRGSERILLVDDEAALVDMARKVLTSMGYAVTSLTSSHEALELFGKAPDRFDLVITDMAMPHLTGKRLAKLLLEIRPDIPIILTTGFSDRITLDEAQETGISTIMLKPMGRNGLSKAIRKALDGD